MHFQSKDLRLFELAKLCALSGATRTMDEWKEQTCKVVVGRCTGQEVAAVPIL